MLTNIKKILPAILSILIFGAGFIYLNLFQNEKYEPEIQLSPKNYLFAEKFGNVYEYSFEDISTKGRVINVRLNKVPGVSEPVIKSNPLSGNKLVVSSNDFSIEKNKARIFISENNGKNWEAADVKLSDEFASSSYSDTWIEYDRTGILYFTAVQYDMHQIKNDGIFFSRSNDDGKTWSSEHKLLTSNLSVNQKTDKPKIFINNENKIFVYWTEVSGYNSYIKFSVSIDSGNTFSEPMTVTGKMAHNASITENENGDLYLTYLNAGEQISILKSTDDGVNWKNTGLNLNIKASGNSVENRFILKSETEKGIRVNSGPSVFMKDNKDLLITYSANSNGNDLSDIYFVTVSLEPNKLNIPVKVNSDNSENDQYLPVITLDSKDNIYIFYQDSRNDVSNSLSESFVSVSTDGGKTFSDHNLSTAAYSPSNVAVDKYFGDYNSFIISENNLIAVWTDGRNGNFDLYSGIINTDHLLCR